MERRWIDVIGGGWGGGAAGGWLAEAGGCVIGCRWGCRRTSEVIDGGVARP
jgi:hypothetical protein